MRNYFRTEDFLRPRARYARFPRLYYSQEPRFIPPLARCSSLIYLGPKDKTVTLLSSIQYNVYATILLYTEDFAHIYLPPSPQNKNSQGERARDNISRARGKFPYTPEFRPKKSARAPSRRGVPTAAVLYIYVGLGARRKNI